MIIARVSGPAAYASVALYVTVFSIAGMLLDFGNEQQLIREGGMRSPRARSVRRIAPALSLLFIVVLLLGAVPMERLLSIHGLRTIFAWGMPALLFWAVQIVPRSELQRTQRFRLMAWVEAGSNIFGWAVAVTCFLLTGDPGCYGVYTLLLYMARALLFWKKTRGIEIAAGGRKGFGYFSSWRLLAVSSVNRVTTTYDDFVVAAAFGGPLLSVYHLAYRIITFMQEFSAGIIRTLAYPVYTAAKDVREIARRFALDSKLVFAITAPPLTWLLLSADWAVPAVLGGAWESAIPIFRLLAFEALRQALLPMAGQALIAAGRERILLRFSLVSAAVLLPVFTLLAFTDLHTFVLGFVLVNTVLNVYYYFLVRSAFAMRQRELLTAWLPGLLASLVLLPASALLRLAVGDGGTHALLLLPVSLLLAFIVYHFMFAEAGAAIRLLLPFSRRASSGGGGRVIVHTDAPFKDDNPHLKGVHEAVVARDEGVDFTWLHYRRDLPEAWRRRFARTTRGKNADRHVIHLHFPVFCYKGHSLPASMLRGGRYLLLFALFRLAGMPIVVSLHDDGAHDFPHRRWEAVFLFLLLQLADAAVTYSRAGTQLLHDSYGRMLGVHALEHAVYRVAVPSADAGALRQRFGLPAEARVLLLLGGDEGYKGYHDALRGIERAGAGDIATLCAGSGAGSHRAVLDETGLPGCILDHRLDGQELADVFAASDFALLPYRRILHSGTAVLALSHSCPVIVPSLGVFPEYAAAHAVGIVYDAELQDPWPSVLEALRRSDREQYAEGIAAFCDTHRISTQAERLACLYREVAAGSGSGEILSAEQAEPAQGS